MFVAEAMTSHPMTLTPTASAKRAAETMRDNDIGDVLVVDRSGHLCGIVTDRDIALRLAADGRKPGSRLKDLCTTDPVAIGPMESLESAVDMMREHAVRRLPVIDDERKPIGVVSLGDAAMRLDEASCLAEISRAPANN